MKLIDFYITRKFISIFFFSLLLFIIIAVAIDVSERINTIIYSGLSFWRVITDYYLGFIPYIIVVLFPVLVFITVILFTSKMSANSEIIAIRAAGVSYNRLLFPYIIIGVSLMVMNWFMINFILPHANEIRTTFEDKYNQKIKKSVSQVGDYYNSLYLRSDKETFVVFKNYDTHNQRANFFSIDKIADYQLKKRISGKYIQWIEDSISWRGINVTVKEKFHNNIVENYFDTMFIPLSFTPKDAILDFHFKDKLFRTELKDYIEKEKLKGANVVPLQLELYKRDATPFLVLILVLIAVMLASKKVKEGRGIQIAVGVILMALYVLLDRISGTFAVKSDFHPLLAAWLPHILFAFVAFFIYRSNCKSAI